MKRVYLDNSATTRVDEAVVADMLPYLTGDYGNASSSHQWGQQARQAIEDSRRRVAQALNAARAGQSPTISPSRGLPRPIPARDAT